MAAVQTGLDVWVKNGFRALRGKRVGAIVNPTSVDQNFRHLADLLKQAEGVSLQILFGPEHGIRGAAQYMEVVEEDLTDKKTGIPVRSLYGHTFESLTPKDEWLQNLDALVFDIQDVGSRYYTYIYTMALAMKSAAKAGIEFYVLDRPNPIGGDQVEGNIVGPRFHSFVGLFALPNRHGMTAGEIARYLNEDQRWGCNLHVVPCEGWKRSDYWEQTGLPFISPSPNMPTVDTALVYPGMCLGEGTNISEGRGTCRPFEQFGAPFLNGDEVVAALEALDLPGVRFRPVVFTPTFDKHKGVSCGGAMIHVTDRKQFCPHLTGIAIFKTAYALAGEKFQWRTDAYEFVDDIPAFDLLCGTDQVRRGIEKGLPLNRIIEGFDRELEGFKPARARAQLYD